MVLSSGEGGCKKAAGCDGVFKQIDYYINKKHDICRVTVCSAREY